MSLIEIIVIGIGLSMDAFAVSICKGLSLIKIKFKHMVLAGVWFGLFQALMPVIGYLLGFKFEEYVTKVDHWIAFILLTIIGINMLKESRKEEKQDDSFSFKTMLILAVATSIDALAVGITFAFLKVNILQSAFIIGITTFIFSVIGIKIGNVFGNKFKSKAEIAGGIVLIFIGVKILVEHLLLS